MPYQTAPLFDATKPGLYKVEAQAIDMSAVPNRWGGVSRRRSFVASNSNMAVSRSKRRSLVILMELVVDQEDPRFSYWVGPATLSVVCERMTEFPLVQYSRSIRPLSNEPIAPSQPRSSKTPMLRAL